MVFKVCGFLLEQAMLAYCFIKVNYIIKLIDKNTELHGKLKTKIIYQMAKTKAPSHQYDWKATIIYLTWYSHV